jgi:hypothetical protein
MGVLGGRAIFDFRKKNRRLMAATYIVPFNFLSDDFGRSVTPLTARRFPNRIEDRGK